MKYTKKIIDLIDKLSIVEQVNFIQELIYGLIGKCGYSNYAYQNARDFFNEIKDSDEYQDDLNSIINSKIELVAKEINDKDYVNTKLQDVESSEYGCFSIRELHCLQRGLAQKNNHWDYECFTLNDLLECTMDDLMRFRNLGQKSLKHILEIVHNLGYNIRDER